MYSRNRIRADSSYRDQIPPSYGGTVFLPSRPAAEEIPVRDERKTVLENASPPSSAQEEVPKPPEPTTWESAEEPPPPKPEKSGFSLPGFLSDIGQEELLLVVLLLLLSGEKEHPLDVIVILLLLLGTQ